MGLFDKMFGTRSEREIKKFTKQVDAIMALEEEYKQLLEEYETAVKERDASRATDGD